MSETSADKRRWILLPIAFILLACFCLPGFAQQATDVAGAPAVADAQTSGAATPGADAMAAAAELAADAAKPAVAAAAPSVPSGGNRATTGQPKRLSDYGLPGLQAKVNLKSLEPWDVVQLIEFLAYRGGLNNIVMGKGIAGLSTKLKFEDVTVGDALEVVLSINNLAYDIKGGIITIMTDAEYRASRGVSFYDNRLVRVVELKYADAARVKEMLTAMKSDGGMIVADPVTGTLILIDTPEKILQMRTVIDKADLSTVARILPTETRTFALQYANVEEIQPEVLAIITKEIGSVRSDKRTKTLIVTDLPHNLKRIEDLVAAFDRKLKQVFIEAKIVQVTLKDEFRLGIDWHHVFDGVDPRFSIGTRVALPIPDPFGSAPVRTGEGFGSLTYRTIVGGGDLSVIIDALQTVGDTKILSNPHVAVIDGKEATIKVITSQPYAEAALESGTTNVVGETYKFIEVGVILAVTPRVSADEFISMAIKPEVSTVTGNYQARYQVPIVQKSFAETSVMIKNGETVIIAGMIENQKGTATSSVPLLGKIPLVGLLFKSQAESTKTQETIVFLSPRIIGGDEPVLLLRDTKKTPKPLRSAGWSEGKQLKAVR